MSGRQGSPAGDDVGAELVNGLQGVRQAVSGHSDLDPRHAEFGELSDPLDERVATTAGTRRHTLHPSHCTHASVVSGFSLNNRCSVADIVRELSQKSQKCNPKVK